MINDFFEGIIAIILLILSILFPTEVYNREAFGGWRDFDRDCQNQRQELLIKASIIPVKFKDKKQCIVLEGKWVSPYTGNVIYSANQIDIDHVLPIALSWEYGSKYWSRPKRVKFYNDPINILPVEKSLNRQKGSKDISEWLPPQNKCNYINRFVTVLEIYELHPPEYKMIQFRNMLKNCKKEKNT